MKKDKLIKSKSFEFALLSIRIYMEMRDKKEYVISNQLLKCSTSIGANVEEALAAESRRDFLHKMSIASKEARESLYWIRLIRKSGLHQISDDHKKEIKEIISILTSIVKTTAKSI